MDERAEERQLEKMVERIEKYQFGLAKEILREKRKVRLDMRNIIEDLEMLEKHQEIERAWLLSQERKGCHSKPKVIKIKPVEVRDW